MLSVQPISTRLRVFSRAWHGLYAFFSLRECSGWLLWQPKQNHLHRNNSNLRKPCSCRTYKLANLQADQSLGYRTDSDNQTEKIHTHNNLQHELTYFAIANPLFSMKPYKLSCLAWNLDHDCRLANAGVLGRSILKSYIDKVTGRSILCCNPCFSLINEKTFTITLVLSLTAIT